MKVAIGMSALMKGRHGQGVDGIGIYSQQLFNGLSRSKSVDALPCSHNFSRDGIDGHEVACLGPFKRQMLHSVLIGSSFADERRLPEGTALFHSLDHYIPKYRDIPVIATIHDAIPLSGKEWFKPLHRIYHMALKRSMYWPNHVITVSHHSKSEIVRELGIPERMVSVVHNGVAKQWFRKPTEDEICSIRKKYGLPKKYVVSVGTIQPRKNFDFLIKAFRCLHEDTKRDHALVIVGKPGSNSEHICAQFSKEEKSGSFRWLNYVEEAELQLLVAGATAMAFPSLAEGFGIPIIESFAAGTPVIASNSTSMPEVAGDAAILASPSDIREFSNGLEALLSDKGLREKLMFKGHRRAREFAWETAVSKTIDVYTEVINHSQQSEGRHISHQRRQG